jgi:hypothetical protein
MMKMLFSSTSTRQQLTTILFLLLCQRLLWSIGAQPPTFSWIRHYEPFSILNVNQLVALYPFDRNTRNVALDRFNTRYLLIAMVVSSGSYLQLICFVLALSQQ